MVLELEICAENSFVKQCYVNYDSFDLTIYGGKDNHVRFKDLI